MQFVLQLPFSTLASNEFLQNLEFFSATRLNSPRIVKNVTVMIGEHEFVVDIVLASLSLCLKQLKRCTITNFTNLHRRVKFNLFGSEIRLTGRRRDRTTYRATYLLSPQAFPVDDGTIRRFADSL